MIPVKLRKETQSMSQEQSPRLSHVGLYVSDVPKMIDFYTRVLGFVVSDGAPDRRITSQPQP
jgi:predicted enzyme related to lactoylglutathione lyase